MSELKVIKVKQSVLANNDLRANELRAQLRHDGVFFLNVMSSPGSGKTTLLVDLINRIKGELSIAVIEADMDAAVDGSNVREKTGVHVIQLNTSGECHLDAKMTSEGIAALGDGHYDLVILENIGNLVCPAEFDTGATMNLVLLSIPEGDDKPLKYPLMFERGQAFVFTKMDAMPVFDFDVDKAKERISRLNPDAFFFAVSAKTGLGMEDLSAFLVKAVRDYQSKVE